ncbi:uncharacterized aarF domain-containing protein kinase At1g71810, chloroplastic isoform X3 [Rhododendron vialii]|uniref:uncharacterized aarF domain-containing protein kinase At1g71810, chloroplastic isoform X3 n=1 Tax=Rhododendron vialii TaxID=182163 RepID=UPI00265EDD42|nr:uncharacterized aarF domain-containing protein kinase At1g71810, chloroplastic isoform X3 [Rhododendron vialii]
MNMLDSRLASMLFPPQRRPPPFPANYSNSGRRGIRRSRILPPARASGRREMDTFTEYSGYLFGLSTSEADSLTDYDISRIFAIYRKKPLVVLRRVVQVGATLGKWFAQRYLDTVADLSERMFEVRAAELREILSQLGPAYIKIAQAISSRAALVDEWASSLFREMDYKKEAKNGLKFRQLYGGLQDVVVPEMYVEQTTCRVLIMEWIEGMKLSEVKDLYLVEIGVYCSFNQLLEFGFYHADPHPGNLLRTCDGKLAYLDFGMMGEFKQELRDGLIEACLHLVNRDFDALAKDFVTLGLLPPTADKDAVTKALTGVFQDAVAKGVRNISFGDLLGNLGTTMYKFKFQIPSYFSLVIRSLAVLEGIAISIDPNYKVLGSTYPWIARKVLTDSSPKLKASLQALLYEDGLFRIDRLESLLTESLRARTEKTLVKKNMEDKDSRIVVKEILSFTLTEKGEFVREILLQEFAKGLDALSIATMDSISSTATASLPFAPSGSFSSMTDEDVINLRTLQRLVLLLSGIQTSESSTTGVKGSDREAFLVFYQSASVQEILPLLSVILELPPDLQQQVLRLPADLTGKLVSRIAARALRRLFL